MARTQGYVAVDLGAGSGRVELLRFDGESLRLEEIHRFPNVPVEVRGTLHWDVLRLWSEVKEGLVRAGRLADVEVVSVGVDTWGVDFALLDSRGDLLGNPVCYRDRRTEGMLEEALRRVGRAEIFAATGVQFLPLNTLYQLLALSRQPSPLFGSAETLLMMPDLFNHWLSGVKVCEFTEATTTQCYDPRRHDWARPLLERLGLPTRILPEVIPPATVLGPLLEGLADETGLSGVTVVAPATHDTGSAVAAVPVQAEGFAYVSSGTWSLVGTELPAPRIDEATLAANFTNEGGIAGTFRYLKNVAGLWLFDECRRFWARQGKTLTPDEAARLASAAPPLVSLVDVDQPIFVRPESMPEAIREECARTGQPVPSDEGAILRCALESLALKYRLMLRTLELLLGHPVTVVHVVGGGSRNELLCQMAADATGLPVVAGPAEATAIGNALGQMLAKGVVSSLAEARELVRRSAQPRTYGPEASPEWEDAFRRYELIYP